MAMSNRFMNVQDPQASVEYQDGWYDLEGKGVDSFRWMKKEATCFVRRVKANEDKILYLLWEYPLFDLDNPRLKITVDGVLESELEVIPGKMEHFVRLRSPHKDFRVSLELNRTLPPEVTHDPRELGLMVKRAEIVSFPEKSLLQSHGWHKKEFDNFYHFQWISGKAEGFFHETWLEQKRYFSFYADSPYGDFRQVLSVACDGYEWARFPLFQKWHFYSVDLRPFLEKKAPFSRGKKRIFELDFKATQTFLEKQHRVNPRELGVKLRDLEFHSDNEEHQRFVFRYQNAVLNFKEMQEGKTKLCSYPRYLGIDIYGKCNIKPPCVYCGWDEMKKAEGKNIDIDVDDRTLMSYGAFFESAEVLVNCSIGEPIHLFISLDAASKETYARLRNDRWESVLSGLLMLDRERKKAGNLPKLFMVFMPMRANLGDLEEFFVLCQRIDADCLILRPLNYVSEHLEAERGGYHFDYQRERLSREELEDVFSKCKTYSHKYGVFVGNQFQFGENTEKVKNGLDIQSL